MDDSIGRLMDAQGGVASTTQLRSAGISRHAINDAVRRGELVRVRRDAVVLTSALSGATPWERRVLVAKAVGHSLAGGEDAKHALSHHSALSVQGLPYFGHDEGVHLCRTDDGRGRRDGLVWVHSPVDPAWTGVVDGVRVVTPALAALQVAALSGPEAGVVCLDGVLHAAEELDKEAAGTRHGPARGEVMAQVDRALAAGFGNMTRRVRLVVDFADGRSESARESRSRWLIHLLGLGPCELQHEVLDDDGELIGIADLKLVGHPVLVEFDGRLKYTERHDLVAEKRREDRIRARGYEFVRLDWSDLDRPQHVRRQVLAAVARASAPGRRSA